MGTSDGKMSIRETALSQHPFFSRLEWTRDSISHKRNTDRQCLKSLPNTLCISCYFWIATEDITSILHKPSHLGACVIAADPFSNLHKTKRMKILRTQAYLL